MKSIFIDYLGVWFDSDFSFSKHIQNVCKGCFSQLRDFRNIRQFFSGVSEVNLHRLQSNQNSAARIATNSCKYTRLTPVLRKLHWLPIQFHSEFKLATLVYKFIHTGFPISLYIYPHTTLLTILDTVLLISSMYQNFNLQFTSPLSSLASVLPLMLTLFYNSLPEDIHASPTIASFRKKLKT